ncbi:DinB family protein [Aquihabitans sp. G128]|uniref:DinB family protein n=1 Tax=Aquihabitans sp. G128 TaxID=2849779 RepID=UPI001C247C76|nr:DinB family protein [Aquihabitans sp. G128]QXC62299.1 DinB family protein [Aquihabitans sp. G128]
MTWTAPEPPPLPDGPLVGAERPILEAFLADQRHELLKACAGLTGEQLATAAQPPSNLTLLGLVRHLAKVERIWFRLRVDAQDVGPLYDPDLGKDHDFEALDPAQAPDALATFATECRLADDAAARYPLDHTIEVHGEPMSLRVVYVHMVHEYARHLGHADLLRQALLA